MLEPFQPSQRSLVLDERHIAVDDLPLRNLMRGVVLLEQSRTLEELAEETAAVQEWLSSPSDTELGRAFAAWVQSVATRMAGTPVELGETLEEASMSLADRAALWPEQYRSEGRTEGTRNTLRTVAERRFGVGTASRLADLLASIDDADRLEEVAWWLVDCQTGDELIGRVSRGGGLGN